ncbi:MAG TPA: L,D-transpeptidase [Microlunatus sp.]|nr:L,D-transpeptidase [Microlunatus sp.]
MNRDDGDPFHSTEHASARHGTPAIPTPLGRRPDRRSLTRRWRTWAARIGWGGLVAVAVTTSLVGTLPQPAPTTTARAPSAQRPDEITTSTAPAVLPRAVNAAELAALPAASTFATVAGAPKDPAPDAETGGMVVHPAVTVAVFAAPGGAPIAALPTHQLGSDTWLPVLAEQPGWALVALPVRPNGTTGWLYINDPLITVARTPYRIVVDRATFILTLSRDGIAVGRWTVGIGKPHAVTPAGRTFLLASIRDNRPTFSPIVLPLGAHSDTYTSYGGGPGTVALHTWPTPDVYGRASSDGCVRIPPDALTVISTTVPLGTVVVIK